MGETHCHHSHANRPTVERALGIAFLLNAGFLTVEVIVGLLAGSLALLSDAGHMASDVIALGLALVAQHLGRTEAGPAFTFGLRRVPVLGALGNAVSILVIAIWILSEAFQRLEQPVPVLGWPVFAAGLIGLGVNVLSAWVLHQTGDSGLNLRGAMLHMLADALGSVGVIVSAAVILLTGFVSVDALVSAGIAALLLISTWPLLRDTVRVLLQTAPAGLSLPALHAALSRHPLVREVVDLHIWQIDAGQVILSAALRTDQASLVELEQAAAEIKRILCAEFHIEHATLEWCSLAHPIRCNVGGQC